MLRIVGILSDSNNGQLKDSHLKIGLSTPIKEYFGAKFHGRGCRSVGCCMNSYSFELNSGYFVSFVAFALHLKDMSHDQHQWGIVPIPGIFLSSKGYPRSYALIGYSNPGDCPNFLNALLLYSPGGGPRRQRWIRARAYRFLLLALDSTPHEGTLH